MSGALIAELGVAVFVLITVAMHVVRPDLPPTRRGISHFVSGSTFVPMTIAFLGLVAALVVDALALRAQPEAPAISVASFWIAAAGLVLIVVAPVDDERRTSWRAPLHLIGGILLFVAMPVAANFAYDASGLAPWVAATLARSLALVAVLFLLAITGTPGLRRGPGVLQRCCFGLFALWAVLVARHLASN